MPILLLLNWTKLSWKRQSTYRFYFSKKGAGNKFRVIYKILTSIISCHYNSSNDKTKLSASLFFSICEKILASDFKTVKLVKFSYYDRRDAVVTESALPYYFWDFLSLLNFKNSKHVFYYNSLFVQHLVEAR